METLLGIAMIYLWVHSLVILFKKVDRTTQYENIVLIGGLISIVLFVLGSL